LTVVSPPEAAATLDISVISSEGQSAASSSTRFGYTLASLPTISSLGTTSGSTAGGNTITINGSYFTGATGVTFGGIAATSFTVLSDSQISAVVPPQAAASVDVQVFTYAGSSATGSSDEYTYNAASSPTISSLATTSGSTAGGTLVTINGSHLLGATAVNFGSVPASFTVNSDTSITAWSPPQASGTVDVTVTTQVGTSATSSSDHFTYSSAGSPSVSGVTPTSGSTAGGDTITITGSGFTSATGVSFGSVAAAGFTVLSDSAIGALSPMLPSGTIDITVTTQVGTSSTSSSDHFTFNNVTGSAPTVTGVSPNTGATGGGQVVVITGTGFTGTSAVKFSSTNATSYTINSDTQITATAPSGSASTLDITVTTNNGTSSTGSADQFTYLSTAAPTVTSLGTTSGTAAGGTSITINGTNFTGATAVTFGGIAAASYTVNSSTSITATTPAETPGVVDVQVTTPSGSSALSSSDQFTFTAASNPTITSLGTSSGSTAGGTSVSITGTNLLGTVDVTFGGVSAASVTINSGTSLTVTTPPSIAGTIDVVVWTTSGNSTAGSSSRFTYSAASAPAISSLGTTSGSTAGGTSVVITGTNFTGTSSVTFGGIPAASFTVNSGTQITATTPPEVAATVPVVVWTPTGSSQVGSSSNFTFTAASAPTVTSLGTTGGSTGGGTSITINGTNFTGTTAVLFGSVPAASFTVNSDTSITAVSPSQAAGTVDVTVTTTAATSSTSSSDHFVYTAAASPSVSALTPTSGSTTGGDVVVITGSHFLGATDLQFGGVSASSFTVLSDSAIEAVSPGGSAATIDVQVVTPSGTSSTSSSDHFTYNSVTAATITSLSATSGSTAGGDTNTLTGTGLLATTAVTIDGQTTAFTVISTTSLTFVTPPYYAGGYNVVVSVPGADSAPARFTYTAASAPAVTSLGTTSGSTAGGTSVTITGTNFGGANGVTFGGVPAASFTVNSSTSITAIAPSAAAAGTVDVIVYTPTGDSAVSSSDHFTYNAASAPTLSSLSLTSGSTVGGIVVNLTGSHFTGATGVSFGTTAASFTVMSDSWITATVPAASAGTVSVTVTSAGGTSSGVNFTYSAPAGPVVIGMTQSSGTTAGGTTFTIVGSGFSAATAVNFGTTAAASYVVLTDNAIQVTSPALSAGTVDVKVTTAAGTSSATSADHFTFSAPSAATVTAVSPTSGTGGGGTVVILTGTNFNNVSAVTFGSVPASVFYVNSSTQITAVSPAEATGTVDITVTTPAGTSGTSSADHFTYTAPNTLSITSVGTAGGAGPTGGGNGVLIVGTGLLGTSSVSFGSNAALSFTVISDSDIFAVAPAGSAGTVSLTVTTPAGSASSNYTYRAAPTISLLSSTSDTASGGVPITITGTGFTGASAVYFGDAAVTSFTVNSDTSISVVVPAHDTGSVNVSVYAPGGESGTLSFTYTSATTDTWTGGNADWGTAADWSTGSTPSSGVDAVIPTGVTVTFSALDTASFHRLTVNGTLDVTGSTMTLAAVSSLGALNLSGGTLTGAGPTTVSGSLGWTGGTIASTSMTLAGTSTLTGSMTDSGTVYDSGSATWTGDGTLSVGRTWDTVSGGSFTANSNGTAQTISGGGTFVNAGTFTKSGSASTTVAGGISATTFNNTGTVTVSAGTLVLNIGTNSGTISLSSGTELDFAGNYTLASGSSITGSGTVKVTGNTLTLGGTMTASSFTINSGAKALGVMTINANVTNSGTLLEDNNNMMAGSNMGVLVINGNFTQTSTGALNFIIGGTTAGTGYDQLQISGTATLAGTLSVGAVSGYTVPTGHTFSLLTFGSYSGSFGTIQNNTTTSMTPQYNSNGFNMLSMADILPDDQDVPVVPEKEERWAVVRATADDSEAVVPLVWQEEESPRALMSDLVLVSVAAEEQPAEEGTAELVWEDGMGLEELLTLPLRLPLAIVEKLAQVVA
jgi:hypothetical protein